MDLEKGFTAEMIHPDRETWDALVRGFRDANLFQTWSYESARPGNAQTVHLAVRKGPSVVAVAQVRTVGLSRRGLGVAYVKWGPLWQPAGQPSDPEIFRQALRALRNEISCKRGFLLRVYPMVYRQPESCLEQVLRQEGYRFLDDGTNQRTLIMDVEPPLEVLRAAQDQKWRNGLNRAEKNGLELVIGDGEEQLEELEAMYRQMTDRKGLVDIADIAHLKAVQKDLPASSRMKIVLCRQNGRPVAGGAFSALGETGLYLLGATSNDGLQAKGSYVVQWAFVRWLKENGFLRYDLNGVNPEGNPGTYHFKRGLAGQAGRETELLGRFQVSDGGIGAVAVHYGVKAVSGYRKLSRALRALRRQLGQLLRG